LKREEPGEKLTKWNFCDYCPAPGKKDWVESSLAQFLETSRQALYVLWQNGRYSLKTPKGAIFSFLEF
jgi:hypothetical protein